MRSRAFVVVFNYMSSPHGCRDKLENIIIIASSLTAPFYPEISELYKGGQYHCFLFYRWENRGTERQTGHPAS